MLTETTTSDAGAHDGDSARAARQRARRVLIRDAALRLFAARGYDAVTVDDIAAEAYVSRRTFFRYFAAKDAVLFGGHQEDLAAFSALIDDGMAEGLAGFAAVKRAFLAMAPALERDREAMVLRQSIVDAAPTLKARDSLQDAEWEQAISAVLRAGGWPEFDANGAAGAVVGGVSVTLLAWRRAARPGALATLAERALTVVERGLGASAAPGGPDPTAGHRGPRDDG